MRICVSSSIFILIIGSYMCVCIYIYIYYIYILYIYIYIYMLYWMYKLKTYAPYGFNERDVYEAF